MMLVRLMFSMPVQLSGQSPPAPLMNPAHQVGAIKNHQSIQKDLKSCLDQNCGDVQVQNFPFLHLLSCFVRVIRASCGIATSYMVQCNTSAALSP